MADKSDFHVGLRIFREFGLSAFGLSGRYLYRQVIYPTESPDPRSTFHDVSVTTLTFSSRGFNCFSFAKLKPPAILWATLGEFRPTRRKFLGPNCCQIIWKTCSFFFTFSTNQTLKRAETSCLFYLSQKRVLFFLPFHKMQLQRTLVVNVGVLGDRNFTAPSVAVSRSSLVLSGEVQPSASWTPQTPETRMIPVLSCTPWNKGQGCE